MSIPILYNMHSFFSNFCVVQTKHGFINVDTMRIFDSSADANLYKHKIRLERFEEISDNKDFNSNQIKFAELLETEEKIVRVCKFMPKDFQNFSCISKAIKPYI